MRQHVLDALVDQPFESNRTIPETDPESITTTKQIEHATFTKEEIEQITHLLRGADLPAWLE